MGITGRRKQSYLRPASHLKQVPHQLPVQAPLNGTCHILGQVLGQNIVHHQPMNRLQLDVHRNRSLVQENHLMVQSLGVKTTLLVDTGHRRSVVGLYQDYLAEQSLPQTA